MARDDYHVIVYQILAYLYMQLKEGEPINGNFLKAESQYLHINERYWQFIMQSLVDEGYIRGISITKAWGREMIIGDLDLCQITPAGIEYLCDNSFLQRAKELLKDIKAIVPFV